MSKKSHAGNIAAAFPDGEYDLANTVIVAFEALTGKLCTLQALKNYVASKGIPSHKRAQLTFEDIEELLCEDLRGTGDLDAVGSTAFVAISELATKHKVPAEALRKRLYRWRKHHLDGWHEVERSARGSRGAKFMYQESAVIGIIRDMKSE